MQFYKTLSQRAETRQAASFIYGSWFHSFVSAGSKIRCNWVAQRSDDDVSQLPTTLRGTTILIPTIRDALMSRTPCYWLAPNIKFSGIDSALVLENEVFAFQVTVRADRRSPIEGLQKELAGLFERRSSEGSVRRTRKGTNQANCNVLGW